MNRASAEFGDFKSRSSWWFLTPVISALKRVREKDHCEFKASPNYEDPSKRREQSLGVGLASVLDALGLNKEQE